MTDDLELISLTEAADTLSVSVRTVRRRIEDGTLTAYQRESDRRAIYLKREDVEQLLVGIAKES